jgi:hypothetical protein
MSASLLTCQTLICAAYSHHPALELHVYARPDLKYSLLFALAKCSIAGLSFAMVWLDIAVFHTEILEISFTEITQELMLTLCAVMFWTAPGRDRKGGFEFLTAGFFTCLLIRELDGLLDPISHSAWLWPFLAVAAIAIGNAGSARHWVLSCVRQRSPHWQRASQCSSFPGSSGWVRSGTRSWGMATSAWPKPLPRKA